MENHLYHLTDANPSTEVDGSHQKALPAVVCPICGPWGTIGIVYPTIQLSHQVEGRPVDLRQYRLAEDALKQEIGPGAFDSRVWKPSSLVGAFVAKGKGKKPGALMIPDFTFSLFIELSAFTRLKNFFPLAGAPAEIKWSSRAKWAESAGIFIETEIPPSLSLVGDDTYSVCEVCGRVAGPMDFLAGVKADSYNPGLGVYRGSVVTTALFCDEAFRDKAHQLGLTGLIYTRVPLVGAD